MKEYWLRRWRSYWNYARPRRIVSLDEDAVRIVWREVYEPAVRELEATHGAPILMTEDEVVEVVMRSFQPGQTGAEALKPILDLFASRLEPYEAKS